LGRRLQIAEGAQARTYAPRLSGGWFLRSGGYVRYVLREFSALPIAAWMLWFLIEISRLHDGSGGYHAHLSWVFVAFSVVCLAFALWHTWTFLGFSGLIMRIPLGEGFVPARVVRGGAYTLFLVISVVIGLLVIWGGTR
jgi:succinate dehydrogenase subunit C